MTPIEQKIMIQRHLPRLKIADVKISDGYWRAYVTLRYTLSGELRRGWYTVKELIDEVGHDKFNSMIIWPPRGAWGKEPK